MTNEATTAVPPPSNGKDKSVESTPVKEGNAAEAKANESTAPEGQNPIAGGPKAKKVYKTELKGWTGKALKVINKANNVSLDLLPQATTRGHEIYYPGVDEINTPWELIEAWFNTEKEPNAFAQWVAERFNDDLLIVWRTHQDEGKFVTAITDPSIQRTPKSLSAYYNRLLMAKQKEIKDNSAKWSVEEKSKAVEERKILWAQYQDAMSKELFSEDEV